MLNARFKLVACLAYSYQNGVMARKSQKTKERLGNKIQKIRKSLGYSQEELAHLVKISRTHMGHIEQGRKSPSLEVMERIAKVLKVSLSELFD